MKFLPSMIILMMIWSIIIIPSEKNIDYNKSDNSSDTQAHNLLDDSFNKSVDYAAQLMEYSFYKKSSLPLTIRPVQVLTRFGIKRRILYADCDIMWVDFPDDTIAPKHFCFKIAQMAANNNYDIPIIPLVGDDKSPCSIKIPFNQHIVVFNRAYAKQEEHPYLRHLLGHELSHYFYKKNGTDKAVLKKFSPLLANYSLPTNILQFGLVSGLTHQFCTISYVYYPLMFWCGFEIISSMTIMKIIYSATKRLQTIEFACDRHALEILGKTPEEKIEIAKEGIAHLSEFHSLTDYLINYLHSYTGSFNTHPSKQERIIQFKKIIKELEATINKK